MKCIIGLGNPGKDYDLTRHNLGFMALDAIASAWGVHFASSTKLHADMLATMIGGETVVLVKPKTYMNESGNTVAKVKQFYKLTNSDIVVVSDDIDLDFGVVRVRTSGSSGGHNGLKSIIAAIGDDFVRVRGGVKNDLLARQPAEDFVLAKFSKSEQAALPGFVDVLVETAADAIE